MSTLAPDPAGARGEIGIAIDLPVAEAARRIMPVMNTAFDPAFGEAWTEGQLRSMLVMPRCHSFVLYQEISRSNQETIGFACTRIAVDSAELLLLAIGPENRRQNLGRMLLKRVLRHSRAAGCTSLFLEARENNPALHLYMALGFTPIGRRPHYYTGKDGKKFDAVTLSHIFGETHSA